MPLLFSVTVCIKRSQNVVTVLGYSLYKAQPVAASHQNTITKICSPIAGLQKKIRILFAAIHSLQKPCRCTLITDCTTPAVNSND